MAKIMVFTSLAGLLAKMSRCTNFLIPLLKIMFFQQLFDSVTVWWSFAQNYPNQKPNQEHLKLRVTNFSFVEVLFELAY